MGKDSSKVGVLRQAYANAKLTLEQRDPGIVVNDERTAAASGKRNITMSASYLRVEKLLDPNITQYPFQIISGVNQQVYPTEQLLTLQDVFFAARVGFYVILERSAAGREEFGNQLMTFPNPQIYGATGLDLNRMVGLWNNGELRLTINNKVITPAWALKKHLVVPERQVNTMAWPNGDGFFNEIDLDEDGMSAVEPNWIFNGGSNIDLQINYPTSLTTYGIGANRFRLVIYYDGFLAQNASSIMK